MDEDLLRIPVVHDPISRMIGSLMYLSARIHKYGSFGFRIDTPPTLMALTAYARDADHAGCKDTRRSTFWSCGLVIVLSLLLQELTSDCLRFVCECDCADIMVDVNAPVEQAPVVAPPTSSD
ncbi:hypothetical protein Tco_1105003 [Tanacetum coccineum]